MAAVSVAVRVLPSPVSISASMPFSIAQPPISCTSKWRWPTAARGRLAHQREALGRERQVAKARAPQARPQRVGARGELRVGERLEPGRGGLGGGDDARQAPGAGLRAAGEVARGGHQPLEPAFARVRALGVAAAPQGARARRHQTAKRRRKSCLTER